MNPRPLSRNREGRPLWPISEGPPSNPPGRQALNIFPWKVPPHFALVLLDLARGERNPQAGPKALHALEWLHLARCGAEAGSMTQGSLAASRPVTPGPLPELLVRETLGNLN